MPDRPGKHLTLNFKRATFFFPRVLRVWPWHGEAASYFFIYMELSVVWCTRRLWRAEGKGLKFYLKAVFHSGRRPQGWAGRRRTALVSGFTETSEKLTRHVRRFSLNSWWNPSGSFRNSCEGQQAKPTIKAFTSAIMYFTCSSFLQFLAVFVNYNRSLKWTCTFLLNILLPELDV